jgi:hypothetical protein
VARRSEILKEAAMSDIDTLKGEIKKLSAKAMQAKMDLHDLSEELPINWQKIKDVAQIAYDSFSELEKKRADLKSLETA